MLPETLREALTFDDVLLAPAYSEVLPKDVDVSTRLTAKIALRMPLVSSAMDTVTEAATAIRMAREGGIGFLHKNMTIEQQAREVTKVKKAESGIVVDPVTIGASMGPVRAGSAPWCSARTRSKRSWTLCSRRMDIGVVEGAGC